MRVVTSNPQPIAELHKRFDHLAKVVGERLLSLDWSSREVCLTWMAQHYHLVRHTMRYINLAAGLSPAEDEKSYAYWSRALKGEHNHHKLLENDARAIGGNLLEQPVVPAAEQLVEAVKDRMIRSNGRALFGYALLLEGFSCTVGAKLRERIVAAHGEKAATFMVVHADADDGDDGHFQLGKDYIAEAYGPADWAAIAEMLERSAELYDELISSVASNSSETRYRKHG